jgi:hypothetical protein
MLFLWGRMAGETSIKYQITYKLSRWYVGDSAGWHMGVHGAQEIMESHSSVENLAPFSHSWFTVMVDV